jgi:hypothetical protein
MLYTEIRTTIADTRVCSRTRKHRNRFKKEFMNVFNGVILANVEFGLAGYLIHTAGKPETGDVDDYFISRK